MWKSRNLTGKVYCKLKVLGFSHSDTLGKSYWECICECGNVSIVQGHCLSSGVTKSCGCYNMIKCKTHGKRGTPEYKVWNNMIQRCDNKNMQGYKNWGGRGITYDIKRKRFEGFRDDMGQAYKEGLSLDREDTNGNYCKENCRRITHKGQCNNIRKNIFIEYNGMRMTMKQRSEHLGVNYHNLRYKLSKKMPISEIIKNHKILFGI